MTGVAIRWCCGERKSIAKATLIKPKSNIQPNMPIFMANSALKISLLFRKQNITDILQINLFLISTNT
ncbi:MAG: hypothetical protein RLZZ171_1293 [Cyanobacteriota bacterium]